MLCGVCDQLCGLDCSCLSLLAQIFKDGSCISTLFYNGPCCALYAFGSVEPELVKHENRGLQWRRSRGWWYGPELLAAWISEGSPWTPEVGGQPGQETETQAETDRQMRGQRKGKEAGKKQKLALVAGGSP